MGERRSPKPQVGGSIPSTPAKRGMKMKNPVTFMREVKEEARKTTWPTKKEVIMTSIFVFGFSVVMALFFLGVDSIFVRIVSALMGLK